MMKIKHPTLFIISIAFYQTQYRQCLHLFSSFDNIILGMTTHVK